MTEVEREAVLYERSRQRAEKLEIKALKARVRALENPEPLKDKPKSEGSPRVQSFVPKRHPDAPENLSFEEALSIFLNRDFFEKFHLYPDFDRLATGALVRVKIGDESNSAYRISVVEGIQLPIY